MLGKINGFKSSFGNNLNDSLIKLPDGTRTKYSAIDYILPKGKNSWEVRSKFQKDPIAVLDNQEEKAFEDKLKCLWNTSRSNPLDIIV